MASLVNIFPIGVVVLCVLAFVIYLTNTQWMAAAYWFSAAQINLVAWLLSRGA